MDIDDRSSPTPEVTTIAVKLQTSTYQAKLAKLHASFARGSPRNRLKLSLSRRPGDTLQRAMADIIQPYASRLTVLNLHIDVDVVESLFRLPAGTFPELQSLRLIVVHLVHTGWLVFRPKDDLTMTKLSALAPRLLSFEFDHGPASYFNHHQMHEDWECRCTFYPLHIGFNFANLNCLDLFTALACDVVHRLLRDCVHLQESTLVVGLAKEFYDTDALSEWITLPALLRLTVRFLSCEAAEAFFGVLVLPGLETLTHGHDFYGGLMDCLERSGTKLSTLFFRDVISLDELEWVELIAHQTEISDLELTGWGQGRFWPSLGQREPIQFLPQLARLIHHTIAIWDVDLIIAFLDSRCTPPTALKAVSLASAHRHTEYDNACPAAAELRRLEGQVGRWEALGLRVDLESGETPCDYCFGHTEGYQTVHGLNSSDDEVDGPFEIDLGIV